MRGWFKRGLERVCVQGSAENFGTRSDAVLVSAEDWSAIEETLYLLAVPGMRESINAGIAEPLTQSATGFNW
jgi:antitoxin YefM